MKAVVRAGFTYSFSTTTEGIRNSTDGECTTASYSATTTTRSSTAALIASCQGQSDSGR